MFILFKQFFKLYEQYYSTTIWALHKHIAGASYKQSLRRRPAMTVCLCVSQLAIVVWQHYCSNHLPKRNLITVFQRSIYDVC